MKSRRAVAWSLALALALAFGLLPAAASAEPRPTETLTGPAAGGDHSCVVTDSTSGTVSCWGDMPRGPQLPSDASAVPMLIPWLKGVTRLVSGRAHACALRGWSGPLHCWGDDAFGQLGDGKPDSTGAVSRLKARDVLALASGDDHVCLSSGNGEVSCWGRNDAGQVGDGSFVDRPRPRSVLKQNGRRLDRVVALAAGPDRTCATLRNGKVSCWGAGDPVARIVSGLPFADMVAVGKDVVCVAALFESPVCQGPEGTVVPVADAPAMLQLVAGGDSVCGLDQLGGTWCWPAVGGPAEQVPSTGSAASLALGRGHACITTVGGAEARCWGAGEQGQLGDGEALDSPTPVQVVFGTDAVSPSASVDPDPASSAVPGLDHTD